MCARFRGYDPLVRRVAALGPPEMEGGDLPGRGGMTFEGPSFAVLHQGKQEIENRI